MRYYIWTMKISDHSEHTEKLCGLRAEDIHKWIDGYFDRQSFDDFIEHGRTAGWDPYNHRQFRHCSEALPEAIKEFSNKYDEKEIECIFTTHIKDDYDGYIPKREDFTNGRFQEKYHESVMEHETILTPQELKKYFNGQRYNSEDGGGKRKLFSRFGLKITLPAVSAIALFVAAIFIFIIPLFHDSLMTEKEKMLKDISSVAISILDYYHSLETDGKLSNERAKQASIDEIAKLRYGTDNDNYFWITDMQPVMIMHPWRTDLNGKDLSNYKDTMNRSGKKLFVESVKLVELSGGGYLEYLWQFKESESKTVPKLSRIEGYSAWNWIIGTGIYIDDVEEEISNLTGKLLLILLVISAFLVIFLIYLTLQSLKIEYGRTQAERGLIEAKERYRALVEASNEGYLLVMNGLNVFSNPTFSRMTGYSEEDISDPDFAEKLFPDLKLKHQIFTETEKNWNKISGFDEFESQIKCRSGALLDVIVRRSKIFLPEENGLLISFRPLLSNRQNILPIFTVESPQSDPSILFVQLKESTNAVSAVRVLNQLPNAVKSLVLKGSSSSDIRLFITKIYKNGVKRLSYFVEKELGPPPCEYSFLSLGSSGRGEMTLFSDQDNALIFRDEDKASDNATIEKNRLYFLNLAVLICKYLNQAGFPYCPGGIMAMNPSWCLSLTEWKNKYNEWFTKADNPSLLDIHVFFDITTGWGSEELVDELYKYIFSELNRHSDFFIHFAQNCLNYKAPKVILGNLKTEIRDGAQVINLKEALIPLMNFTRISALREGLTTTSTLDRLKSLHELGKIETNSYKDMVQAFEVLWRLRFSNQVFAHGELRKVNDNLIPSNLSELNYKGLKEAVSVVSAVQSRLSYEFLGVDLS